MPQGTRPGPYTSQETRDIARRLRHQMTPASLRLWSRLRGKGLRGLKFRREHPIGNFVVDFYCHAARIAIELNGFAFEESDEEASKRAAFLAEREVEVLRIHQRTGPLSNPHGVRENRPHQPGPSGRGCD